MANPGLFGGMRSKRNRGVGISWPAGVKGFVASTAFSSLHLLAIAASIWAFVLCIYSSPRPIKIRNRGEEEGGGPGGHRGA